MKVLKKFGVIAIAVAMIASMSGCSSIQRVASALKGGDAAEVEGTWKFATDVTEVLNDEFINAGMEGYVSVDKLVIEYTCTYNADGTFKIEVDKEKLQTDFNDLSEEIRDDLYNYYQADLDAMESTLTVDEYLANYDVTMDGMLAEMFGAETVDAYATMFEAEGNFEAVDGKLFCSAGFDYMPDPKVYETYETDGTTLKLLEYVNETEDYNPDEYYDFYPMEGTKVVE